LAQAVARYVWVLFRSKFVSSAVKQNFIGLAAAFLALGAPILAAPAIAADAGGHKKDDSGLDKVMQGSLLPVRLGGIVAGVAIGTPVAVARESYKSYLDLTGAGAEQIHGRDSAPVCVLVSLFTLPTGIVLGACKGSYYGVKNGVTKGFNEPFNSDSFSFGTLDEVDK
jgi:hypothetical protein